MPQLSPTTGIFIFLSVIMTFLFVYLLMIRMTSPISMNNKTNSSKLTMVFS
nr:ATP synthase F0 subunit 8 [Carychium tridentatum]WIV81383.1 ATP synthase F0 subunit 8 [Carychium tridentatum]